MKPFRFLFLTVLILILTFTGCSKSEPTEPDILEILADAKVPDYVDVQLIDYNGIGRSGTPLSDLNSIVIHYVGNPGTSAQANRDYFNRPETQVSSHFIVGLNGEVIQCLPLTEKSAASNHRNADTLSIEVCHPDETGQFNQKTYDSLTKLTAWLCKLCEFDRENIIRHYDVTSKECPRYFVQNPTAWNQFLNDVMIEKWDSYGINEHILQENND